MDSPRKFYLLSLVLLAILGGVGLVQGLWTQRWAAQEPEGSPAGDLERVPLTIGAWDGKAIDPTARNHPFAEDGGHLLRRYVNRSDGATVTVLLRRGLRGPMVIKHLPTECYISAGYEFAEQPKRFLTPRADRQGDDEFWVATFRKTNEVIPTSVRVYWSWCGAGDWKTPDNPRLAFAAYRFLYKVYFVRSLLHEDEAFEGSPTHDFIREFAQEFRQALFTP